jgi:probable rRNA maturation factor
MTTRRKTAQAVDVIVAGAAWTRTLRTVRAAVRRAAEAALAAAGPKKTPVALNVLLTSDQAVRKLNAVYRGKDRATNVLSFPSGEAQFLGDIAVAYGVSAREANAEGKTLTAHLSHLVIHGVLHLLGYDHGRDKDALTMEQLERQILARLGIADPYAVPADARKPQAKRPRAKGRARR